MVPVCYHFFQGLIPDIWLQTMERVYDPLLITGMSLVVCYWSEVIFDLIMCNVIGNYAIHICRPSFWKMSALTHQKVAAFSPNPGWLLPSLICFYTLLLLFNSSLFIPVQAGPFILVGFPSFQSFLPNHSY